MGGCGGGGVPRRGAPGGSAGGLLRRAARSLATAGTSAGGFQAPSFSFQTWRSAFFGSASTLSTSCLRENGPVRSPASAMYQASPSSGAGTVAIGPVVRRGGSANSAGFGASTVRSES